MKTPLKRDGPIGLKQGWGFTAVEVMMILAIIGALTAISIPVYRYFVSQAMDSIRYQTNILNNAYNQYLSEGGRLAQTLEEALASLSSSDGITIQPPRTIRVGLSNYNLTYDPTNGKFQYMQFGTRILNVANNGGTATFNGTVTGLPTMPTFMLTTQLINGTRQFVIHNSGNYTGVRYGNRPVEAMPVYYNLTNFLSDLPISADRFNPTHTKVLSLYKDNMRYDWEFLLWVDSNNQLNLRTRAVGAAQL